MAGLSKGLHEDIAPSVLRAASTPERDEQRMDAAHSEEWQDSEGLTAWPSAVGLRQVIWSGRARCDPSRFGIDRQTTIEETDIADAFDLSSAQSSPSRSMGCNRHSIRRTAAAVK